MNSSALSHIDIHGHARMVDVGDKPVSQREASAYGEISVKPEVIVILKANGVPKGDVLAAARIAGIMAAKRTDNLIPLCHTLSIDAVRISFAVESDRICIRSTVSCEGKTGVEMEALTAVSVAALTIYDMCKALDKSMTIGPIYLQSKTGGKSGEYRREPT